ncbi:MAG: hypothetical protein KJ964_14220 [Verrucomicrobia bacterium]|nr:hypothetical protein [Verrucomicrobiota bacterium]MBU1736398.1 hypothetical protein [Verrucomicrobiota bacterium]MBU1857867.1 hypothetical protein [Verrucomicrobiota bacterium]
MKNVETKKRKEGKNITRETLDLLTETTKGKKGRDVCPRNTRNNAKVLNFKGEYFSQFIFRAKRRRKIAKKPLSLRDFILLLFLATFSACPT